jgi:hypothetical protein
VRVSTWVEEDKPLITRIAPEPYVADFFTAYDEICKFVTGPLVIPHGTSYVDKFGVRVSPGTA